MSEKCTSGDHINCPSCDCPCHLKPHEGHLLDFETMRRLMFTWKDSYAKQEQQLAEARDKIARQEEELRILAAQRQDYKAQAAEARALILEGLNTPEIWSQLQYSTGNFEVFKAHLWDYKNKYGL